MRDRLIELLSGFYKEYAGGHYVFYLTDEEAEEVADHLIANGVRVMPFVAMIEKTTVNGEFCRKKSEQNHNGRYCVVYEDKTKWQTPLIDICGLIPFDKCEAIEEMVMKGGGEE